MQDICQQRLCGADAGAMAATQPLVYSAEMTCVEMQSDMYTALAPCRFYQETVEKWCRHMHVAFSMTVVT